MGSLAIELDPVTWEDFKYQEYAVKDAKHWVENEAYPNLIFITGGSGTGKTRFAKLLVQTIHCLNRKPGEFKNCGHCEVCKRDPRDSSLSSNVIWVQSGTGDQMAKQVNLALQEANTPPFAAEDHRYYKIIIFDELQSLKVHLTKLLFYPDLNNRTEDNRIIFIAITMSPDSIKDIELEAFKSRASYLDFRPFTDQQIFNILHHHFPNAPAQSLRMVAKDAQGNLRSAYNRLDDCRRSSPALNAVDVALRLQFCDAQLRQRIWQLTEQATYGQTGIGAFSQLKKLWENIEYRVDEKKLLSQLLDDLTASFDLKPTQIKSDALLLFFQQICTPSPIRLKQFMKLFVSQHLIEPEVFQSETASVAQVISHASRK